MTHDYKRNGTTSLYAALEIATGEITGSCYPRHTHQEFLGFLNRLVKAYSRQPLHVVLDNSSTHSTPEVTAWLARHKRVALTDLLPSSEVRCRRQPGVVLSQ
jgi:DDE superfamily endonuclease